MSLGNLDPLTPDQDEFWAAIEKAAVEDNGSTARGLLKAGRPIFYREDDTPAGLAIKEYPDGRRELVKPVGKTHVVVCVLEAAA